MQPTDRSDHVHCGVNRAACVVLVGLRVAEIHQYPVAKQLRDVAVVRTHRPRHGVVVGTNDAAQIFRVEHRCQFGRTDQVAEHYRQLASFGSCDADRCWWHCRLIHTRMAATAQ